MSAELENGPLQTERQPDGRRCLLRSIVVKVDDLKITVPQGTLTDYSSIPCFGRVLVRWSKVDVAGVVHDYLYATGSLPRNRADEIWRVVAVSGEHHANRFQAWTAWFFLRLGGWVAWYEHRGYGVKDAVQAAFATIKARFSHSHFAR